MAELGANELKKLARDFLVGRGGEAELEDTKRAMDAGSQLAVALLEEMQSALAETAPAGFSPDQWKEVDARVAALIQPLAKSGFGLGFLGRFFSGLFRKKAAPAASGRIKRKGAPDAEAAPVSAAPASAAPSSLIAGEAPVAAPLPGGDTAEGLEEMAPIAPVAALSEASAGSPAAAAAPASRQGADSAPEASVGGAAKEKAAKPANTRSAAGGKALKALLLGALVILCIGLAGWGVWKLYPLLQAKWKAATKAAAVPPAAATPLPSPSPTPRSSMPMRLQPPPSQSEPLPSELPPMTPQPAGSVHGIPDLEAKDAQGRPGLPLP